MFRNFKNRRTVLLFGLLVVAPLLIAGCLGGNAGSNTGHGELLGEAEVMNLSAEDILYRLNSSEVESFHAAYVFRMSRNGELMMGHRPGQESELWYDGPGTYRLEPPGPNGSVLVSDGERSWIYRPVENEVKVSDADSVGLGYARIPALVEAKLRPEPPLKPKGAPGPNRTTEIRATVLRTEEYDGKPCVVVRIEEVAAPGVTRITPAEGEFLVWIDREYWFPLKIRVKSSGESENVSSLLAYRNVTYNPNFPEGTFEFDVPEDVAVRTPTPPKRPPSPESYSSTEDLREAGYEVPIPETPEGAEIIDILVEVDENDEIQGLNVIYMSRGLLSFQLTPIQSGPSIYRETEAVDINGVEGQFVAGRTFEGERGTGHEASKLYWRCGRFNATLGATELSRDEMVAMAESAGCEGGDD